jgi:hypothetical protein
MWCVFVQKLNVLGISKKIEKIIELNEVTYKELILHIDVEAYSGKITFNIVKGNKSKEYADGNAISA